MGAITHSIEVNAPLETVYNQWTRFEDFPRFMEGVEEVRRDGPNRLFWRVKIGGQEKQWEAEITEQTPNTRIAWRNVEGVANMGAVTFEHVDVSQTRITLTMEYEPEGFFEKAGDALGIPVGQVAEDLNRFREFIENGGSQPGGWKSQIKPIDLTEHDVKEGDASIMGQSTRGEPLSHEPKISPAAIVTEAIASGMHETGSHRIGAKGRESFEKGEEDTEVENGQEAVTEKEPSVEESLAIYPGAVGAGAPTHEQIARRAYELYLERGQTPGDARGDWLTAEKELSEKSGDNRSG